MQHLNQRMRFVYLSNLQPTKAQMSLRTSCKISTEPSPPPPPLTPALTHSQLKTDNFFAEVFCDKILRQNSTLLGGVPSVFTCVLGAQYDHLIETVLLSTNSIFLLRNKTNNYGLNIIKESGLVVLSVYAGMAVRRQLSVSSSTCHRSCDQSCSN